MPLPINVMVTQGICKDKFVSILFRPFPIQCFRRVSHSSAGLLELCHSAFGLSAYKDHVIAELVRSFFIPELLIHNSANVWAFQPRSGKNPLFIEPRCEEVKTS